MKIGEVFNKVCWLFYKIKIIFYWLAHYSLLKSWMKLSVRFLKKCFCICTVNLFFIFLAELFIIIFIIHIFVTDSAKIEPRSFNGEPISQKFYPPLTDSSWKTLKFPDWNCFKLDCNIHISSQFDLERLKLSFQDERCTL